MEKRALGLMFILLLSACSATVVPEPKPGIASSENPPTIPDAKSSSSTGEIQGNHLSTGLGPETSQVLNISQPGRVRKIPAPGEKRGPLKNKPASPTLVDGKDTQSPIGK